MARDDLDEGLGVGDHQDGGQDGRQGDLGRHALGDGATAAEGAQLGRTAEDQGGAHELGPDQQHAGQEGGQHEGRELGVQDVEEAGPVDRIEHLDEQADHQRRQPQGRRQIGHAAHQQLQAAHRRQALGRDQAQVLEVTLEPAVVAADEVGDRRRGLFPRSVQRGGDVDGPAGAAHQGGLDDVMAHDVTAEGLAALQVRQAAAGGEGARADDGVVAPVAGFRTSPVGQSGSGDAAVQAHRILGHAREDGAGLDDDRGGLDQADARIALHGVDHAQQGLAGHGAVGVQDDHVLIGAAETTDPFGQVAGLAFGIVGAATVEGLGVGGHAERLEHRTLGGGGVFLGRVAQHEDVEGRRGAQTRQAGIDLGQAREGRTGVLVVQRHQQGGAGARHRRMRREGEVRLILAAQHDEQAHQAADEPAGDGGDQDHEQAEGQDLGAVPTLAGIEVEGRDGRQAGQDDGAGQQGQASRRDRARRGRGRHVGDGVGRGQGLNRHGQRRLVGQPRPARRLRAVDRRLDFSLFDRPDRQLVHAALDAPE